MPKRILEGVVVSDKGNKTIVVNVDDLAAAKAQGRNDVRVSDTIFRHDLPDPAN